MHQFFHNLVSLLVFRERVLNFRIVAVVRQYFISHCSDIHHFKLKCTIIYIFLTRMVYETVSKVALDFVSCIQILAQNCFNDVKLSFMLIELVLVLNVRT